MREDAASDRTGQACADAGEAIAETRRMLAALDAGRAACAALIAGSSDPVEVTAAERRMADAQRDLRDTLAALTRAAAALENVEAAIVVGGLAAAPDPGPPRQAAARHRRARIPGPRDPATQAPRLRVVRNLIPAPVLAFAARHGLTAWHLAIAAGLAGTALAVAGPHLAGRHAPALAAAGRGGSLGLASASPVPAGAGKTTRRTVGPVSDADTSSLALLALGLPATPGTQTAAPAATAAPGPSPAASSPSPGFLLISPADGLDLGSLASGAVTLTAWGGPVTWQALTPPDGITVAPSSGTLQPGRRVTLQITLSSLLALAAGSDTVTIATGADATTTQDITLTWTGPPSPSPSPTGPLPSVSATATALGVTTAAGV